MTTGWCFRLLGPVTAQYDGRDVEIGGPTARALLAVLLLRGGPGTGTAELISAVWGGPGEATRDSLYQYVRTLRGALAPDRPGASLVARRPGYRLLVADEAVDWRRFALLVGQARRIRADRGEIARAAALLGEALGLWHGPPLADVGERLAPIRRDMAERRLTTIEELAAIEAARGGPERVVDLLTEESAREPGRERSAALLIGALATLGRRDEAGFVFRRTRRHLAEQQGLDPGDEVTAAYQACLRGRPAVRSAGHRPGRQVSGPPRADGHSVLAPAEALDRLPRRLGVDGQRSPYDPDEHAALHRGLFDGRRLFVVLDDVADAARSAFCCPPCRAAARSSPAAPGCPPWTMPPCWRWTCSPRHRSCGCSAPWWGWTGWQPGPTLTPGYGGLCGFAAYCPWRSA